MKKFKVQSSKFKVSGFSIIELLVVVSVFAILAVLTTQSLVLTLKGARKSEALIQVRENVDYATNIMERVLRGAVDIACTTDLRIDFTDNQGTTSFFECTGGSSGRIASGSANITSNEVNIRCDTGGVFACQFPVNVPPIVIINITAEDAASSGAEGAQYTTSTRVVLRSY